MLNEFIINRIEEQINLINNIINKKLNLYLNFFQTFIKNLFNQINYKAHLVNKNSSSRLKKNKIIEGKIHSLCLLRDGRLVLSSYRIIIYNKHNYQSDIIIDSDHYVFSTCVLRNGNLATCGSNHNINIYEIDGNKYKLIHTLKGHKGWLNKVIELEDGSLCSCSEDKRIRIWDKNYQFSQTLTGHTDVVRAIIEINDYIISASDDNSVRKWNKNTFQSVQVDREIYCCNNNSLAKVKENTIIIGGLDELVMLDILSFEYRSFKSKQLGYIFSILVLRENKILFGNGKGDIICFDSLSDQIFLIQNVHKKAVYSIIKNEDNQIISSSEDVTINIYE